jgi:hypothetical protein
MATMFLFFRLRYFHDAAALRRCARADPERTRALDERYEALRRRLIEQLGAARVDFRGSTPGPERGEDRDCRMGITLIGYANALGELERNMAGGAK